MPKMRSDRVVIQMLGVRTPEERRYLQEVTQHLDFFQEQVPGYVEEREQLRKQLRPHDSAENRQFNHRLLTGFLADWEIPYVGGPAQSAAVILEAPYSHSPHLGGSRDAISVRGFADPFLTVVVDLSYTQKAIVESLKEVIRFHHRTTPRKKIRTLKEDAERLRDARAVFEMRKNQKMTIEQVRKEKGWSADWVVDLSGVYGRCTERGGPAREVPQISSTVFMEKHAAAAKAVRASARKKR
jgi:hypothetical protein